MAKFKPHQIEFIGGESVQWPGKDTPGLPEHWRHLHRAVDAIRQTVSGVDSKLEDIEANRDLNEVGRTRQLSDIGLATIARVNEVAPLNTARVKAAERIAALDAEMAAHKAAPVEPADIAMAGEIRAALRGMSSQERIRFIHDNLDQPGLVGAVTSAAGYLSGLSPTEQAEVGTRYAERHYGPQVAEKAALTRALRELDVGVNRAHELVARRSRVARNVHGEWAVSEVAAGGPKPPARPIPGGMAA